MEYFKLIVPFILFYIVKHDVNGLPLEPASDMVSYFSGPSRILGGTDAPEGYAPYMVALVIGDDLTLMVCGGSMVLPDLVLTAAHCIYINEESYGLMRTFHSIIGSNNWKTGGTVFEFKDYKMHPQWDPVLVKNDVGFLTLTKKAELSDTLSLVNLDFNWYGGGQQAHVTGWGWILNRHMTPFHLQLLRVSVLSSEECEERVHHATVTLWPEAPPLNTTIEICSFQSAGYGLCYGDSGSPLMLTETRTQIGIASWAIPCANGAPDVYTRISAFADYILAYINNHRKTYV